MSCQLRFCRDIWSYSPYGMAPILIQKRTDIHTVCTPTAVKLVSITVVLEQWPIAKATWPRARQSTLDARQRSPDSFWVHGRKDQPPPQTREWSKSGPLRQPTGGEMIHRLRPPLAVGLVHSKPSLFDS